EEGLLAVLAVVRLSELAARRQELARTDREAARLDAAEDLRREAATDCVRLDQDEGLLDGHRPRRITIRLVGADGVRASAARRPSAPPASRSTGTPARAPRAAACSSCTPASASSCRSGRRGTTRRPRNGRPDSGGRALRAGPPSP